MFEIHRASDGRIVLAGRFDAARTDEARRFFEGVTESGSVDFAALDYISSAGLGVLLAAQRRLGERGQRLRLVNLNRHLRDVFAIAGFDHVFEIA